MKARPFTYWLIVCGWSLTTAVFGSSCSQPDRPKECEPNRSGENCEACATGYFGETCAPCTCVNGVCDDGLEGDGLCLLCNSGWEGENCNVCAEGYYDTDCAACRCVHGVCDDGLSGTGTCSECASGWAGELCDVCAPGRFGASCAACNCVNGVCDDGIEGDGSCVPGSCTGNWAGENCSICAPGFAGATCADCEPGRYGASCDPCLCQMGICDDGIDGSGACQSCSSGWDGNLCDQCAGGYFGPDCTPCTCQNGECDDGLAGDGMCLPESCTDNWSGDDCDTCATGFTGSACEECASGFHGEACLPCDCQNGVCDDGLTGSGECVSCAEGWALPLCSECSPGYYGPSCAPCDCEHGDCDEGSAGTGSCECHDGWTGPTCAEVQEAQVLINEVQTVHTYSGAYRDHLELLVTRSGSMLGISVRERPTSFGTSSHIVFPDMRVSAGELIVLHSDSAGHDIGLEWGACETHMAEATGSDASPDAWDCSLNATVPFHNADTTIAVINRANDEITDAIYLTADGADAATVVLDSLDLLLSQGEWAPAGSYTVGTMQTIGVINTCSSDETVDPFGPSAITMQRIPGADTQTKDDWECASGTFGAPNEVPFNVVEAVSTSNTTVTVTFSALPDATEAGLASNYQIQGGAGLTMLAASLEGKVVTLTTSTQIPIVYTVTVSNVCRGHLGAPLTVASADFTGRCAIGGVGDVVISEVSTTDGLGIENVEFVELYNRTDACIDLAGWLLKSKTSSGTVSNYSSALSAGKHIKSHNFFLFAVGNVGTMPDQNISRDGLEDSSNGVALFNGTTLIDAVVWGLVTGEPGDWTTSGTISFTGTGSNALERKANGSSTAASMGPGGVDELAGNGYRTGSSASDFVVQTFKNPQNSHMSGEP